jgi:Spy/CpxP family protein refolding chaperone
MKKFMGMMVVGLILSAAVLALGLNARANDQEGQTKEGSHQYSKTVDGQDHRDGLGMMDRLKDKLDLSDEQLKEIKSISQKDREKSQTLREKLKTDVGNLSEKLKSGADGGVLKSLLEKVYADQNSLAVFRQKQMEETRNVLTPTQQAKWVVGMGEKRQGGRSKFKKHDQDSKAPKDKTESSSDEAQTVAE